MKIVVRVGGSVVASPPNPELMVQYANIFKKMKSEGHKIVAVIGGGTLARDFIKISSKMGLNDSQKDWIAIFISRVFALLFVMWFNELGCGTVPVSIEEVVNCYKKDKIVVLGGLKPGMTTDAVGAMVAKKLKADLLIKATDQEGIFTKDPDKFKDAKKLNRICYDDVYALLEENKHKAGIQQIIDPVAIQILRKSKVKTIVVNGFNPQNLHLVINGKKIGTIIE